MQAKGIRGLDRDTEVKAEKKKQTPRGATVENDPEV